MKYMKLGTRPDTFYTEEATRTVISDIPSDLVIKVDNTTFLLHKYSLLPKCGLLQRLCSDSEDSSITTTVDLHDIPGGGDAFELCAKFCYGIAVNISAHNFVSAFCAAKFLRMTEAIEKGNLVAKLEAFFNACILQGWKESLVTLQSTASLPEWSENLGIIRRCIDSIVDKILTPPSKVKWSYTYTRTGYSKKHHQSVPRDWWTEDISNLHIDIFRCILVTLRSTNLLPPQLIGEALHVYSCQWLPISKNSRSSENSGSENDAAAVEKNRRVLEMIVSLIPVEEGSVSVGFLIRLLNVANLLGVSPVTKAELVRRSSQQLQEATVSDLLLPTLLTSSNQHTYDIDLIKVVLESFLEQQRRQSLADNINPLRSIRKVGVMIDTYLQVVARDINIPVTKITSLAEALPDSARPTHDELYKAIKIYLKEHPDLTKAEKKHLCRTLNCQKLSPDTRADVVKNEQLPLRTVVQVLFYEQEGATRGTGSEPQHQELITKEQRPAKRDDKCTSRPGLDKKGFKENDTTRNAYPSSTGRYHHTSMKSDERLQLESEKGITKEIRRESGSRRGKEIEEVSGSKTDTKQIKHDRDPRAV
ncbi:hypothetical protein Nepgr_007056 [Nepenthes gracilis]|uniref:Phototropic-responsive NPH3 family protein n=1 Tax=Nepenthes gracilis TaxID=150966 RepID=A0AAD3S6G0_NEPGR|nr:hypothetical protein Nepgr_007056 [Nepenthes gracilis]